MFLLLACTPPLATDYNNFPFLEMDIEHLQEGYTQGDFTIAEVTQAYLDRIVAIDEKGPVLNSFIAINPDAIRIAQSLDKERANGNFRGPLHGIPIVLKDNIDTHDAMSTTAGSRALKGSKPLQDSEVTKHLREAGAAILGKDK